MECYRTLQEHVDNGWNLFYFFRCRSTSHSSSGDVDLAVAALSKANDADQEAALSVIQSINLNLYNSSGVVQTAQTAGSQLNLRA